MGHIADFLAQRQQFKCTVNETCSRCWSALHHRSQDDIRPFAACAWSMIVGAWSMSRVELN